MSLLAAGIGLWAWVNVERDPSVEAGVAVGAGLVAFVLVGVNALFLRALLLQLEATREALRTERDALSIANQGLEDGREVTRRAASPYVHPVQAPNSGIRVQNSGPGLATNITFHQYRRDKGRYRGNHGALAALPPNSDPVPIQMYSGLDGEGDLKSSEIFGIECVDVLGGLHLRWFRAAAPGHFDEVPGGVVPDSAPVPPSGEMSADVLLLRERADWRTLQDR